MGNGEMGNDEVACHHRTAAVVVTAACLAISHSVSLLGYTNIL